MGSTVVGIDVGNDVSEVALARNKGIDVLLNDESKRETASMVAFTAKQRFMGGLALGGQAMNPSNTIFNLKRLIGKQFRDPMLQKDIAMMPFKIVEGPGGGLLVEVNYKGEQTTFTPEQIMGMLLVDLKGIAETEQKARVTDCVLSIPVFFTDTQRRAMLDAAHIAGLKILRLLPETTATALSYGLFKTDLSDEVATNVAFVDVGHASTQVCIVALKKKEMRVLSQAFDSDLGGRDLDNLLFDHFAEQFRKSPGIDVRTNKKAVLRLLLAIEKLKKILSANTDAQLSVECLMNDLDVRGSMTRDAFEAMAAPMAARFKVPLQQALSDSGLSLDQIAEVQLVGCSSRVPFMTRIVADFFGKEPLKSLNAAESVARGCALMGAMLSPTFRVREFNVIDAYPFALALTWAKSDGDGVKREIVFARNHYLPSSKILSFYRGEGFTVRAEYDEPERLPSGSHPEIADIVVGPIHPTVAGGDTPKIKVAVKLTLHGTIEVESVTMFEDEPGVEDTPAAAGADAGADIKMDDGAPAATADAAAAGGGAEMDIDATAAGAPGVDAAGKKKKKAQKRSDVPAALVPLPVDSRLTKPDVTKFVEREYELASWDRLQEETKERKNAVEAYIYDTRRRLGSDLEPFALPASKAALEKMLDDTEAWLFDDGEDAEKGVYIDRLAALKALGDPIADRASEDAARGPAASALRSAAHGFAAQAGDALHDHIESSDLSKVRAECTTSLSWLEDKLKQQAATAKTAPPAVLAKDITKKAEVLTNFCRPLLGKARPKPALTPAPPPPPPPPPAAADVAPMETATDFPKASDMD